MWLLVFFDFPTHTKTDRRNAARFRRDLLKDGFGMFQFSIYVRHCNNKEHADTHTRRVKTMLPPKGKTGILCLTDLQFETMQVFEGVDSVMNGKVPEQLQLF